MKAPIVTTCRCGRHFWRYAERRWYLACATGAVPAPATLACMKGLVP